MCVTVCWCECVCVYVVVLYAIIVGYPLRAKRVVCCQPCLLNNAVCLRLWVGLCVVMMSLSVTLSNVVHWRLRVMICDFMTSLSAMFRK